MHGMRLLRWFVAAALLANLGYAVWRWGALQFIGLAPASERDPGRAELQVRPTALRVLTPQAAAAAAAAVIPANTPTVGPPSPTLPLGGAAEPAASAADAPLPAASAATPTAALPSGTLSCLEIGPLDSNAAIDSTERALAAVLPERGWVRESRPGGAQYVVFVGPVLSRDAARQRREELVKLKMSFEAVELPGGQQGGYSLGRHDSEAAAQAALEAFRERGLRNARVALARPSGAARTWLRLDNQRLVAADAVRALPPAQIGGNPASPCVVGSVMSVTTPR